MNNNEKITILTDEFLNEIKVKFRKAGYKTKTTKQSAIVETQFIKGNEVIWFSGWRKGTYGINYSIIHDLGKQDKVSYEDTEIDIFVMPGNDPKSYGAGMVKGNIATDEELIKYNVNLIRANKWIEDNIKGE